ncbi:ABC transporter permease [Clostridium sp. JNZ J1-5]
MVLDNRIKRVLSEHKGQYIGSIMLVILSCMLFTSFNLTFKNTNDNMDSFIEKNILSDATAVFQKPIENISEIENKFNTKVEERKQFDYKLKNSTTLRVFSKSSKINIPYITEGSDIQGENEILLDPSFAKFHNIKLRDTIKLSPYEFKVVGFMSLPDYMYPLKSEADIMVDSNAFGIAVISEKDILKFNNTLSYYNFKFIDNNSSKVKEYISKTNPILFWQDKSENPRYTLIAKKLESSAQLGILLPIIILILTCLLLSIIMWRMIKSEFIQIGTLYALGYTKKEILKHYIKFPIIISLLGGILGTILGIITVSPLLHYMITYFNIPSIDSSYSTLYIAISPIIPLIFLVTSVWIIASKALKLSPLQLMRGNIGNRKVGKLEKRLKLYRFKFKTKFKIRELWRNIPRTLILILGVTIASMFLLLGFISKNSIDSILEEGYKNTYKYEYNYILNKIHNENTYGGDEYNSSSFKTGENGENFSIYGLKSNAKSINLVDKNNSPLVFDRTIITLPLAEELNLSIGDTIQVINNYTNVKSSLKIDAIANSYMDKAIYMPLNKFNKIMNLPEDSFIGIYSDKTLNIDNSKIFKLGSKTESIAAFNSIIEPLKYSLIIMGLISAIISLIVIYIITSLIVEENKGSISMLKVLGYTNKEINSLIINSGRIPVIIGYLISIPLLIASIKKLMDSVTKGINFSLPININYIYTIAGFVIIYITYELSKYLARKKVLSVQMSDSLKIQRE